MVLAFAPTLVAFISTPVHSLTVPSNRLLVSIRLAHASSLMAHGSAQPLIPVVSSSDDETCQGDVEGGGARRCHFGTRPSLRSSREAMQYFVDRLEEKHFTAVSLDKARRVFVRRPVAHVFDRRARHSACLRLSAFVFLFLVFVSAMVFWRLCPWILVACTFVSTLCSLAEISGRPVGRRSPAMYAHVHVSVYVYLYVHVRVRVHACVHEHVHAHVHVCWHV